MIYSMTFQNYFLIKKEYKTRDVKEILSNKLDLTEEFLLYPTVSYANKDNYLESFTDKDFVKENTYPNKNDDGFVYNLTNNHDRKN